jgi:hypothetical protein
MAEEDDPFGMVTQAAVQMHELFRSLLNAGFTESQAMRLVIGIATAKPRDADG